MERQEVINAAIALNLNIKKNWKTVKILAMVEEKIEAMNLVLAGKPKLAGISPDMVIVDETKTFCGVSPITGEKIYK